MKVENNNPYTSSSEIDLLISEIENLRAKLRKVKYGDYVLADDINLLVDIVERQVRLNELFKEKIVPPPVTTFYNYLTSKLPITVPPPRYPPPYKGLMVQLQKAYTFTFEFKPATSLEIVSPTKTFTAIEFKPATSLEIVSPTKTSTYEFKPKTSLEVV